MNSPTESEAKQALDRIRSMLQRTEANGATPNEVEAAAKHIGRLLMQFPQLLIGTEATTHSGIAWATPRPPSNWTGATVSFQHKGIEGQSVNAFLFTINGKKTWLHKAWIHADLNSVTIPEWLAIEKGLL